MYIRWSFSFGSLEPFFDVFGHEPMKHIVTLCDSSLALFGSLMSSTRWPLELLFLFAFFVPPLLGLP